MDAPPLFARNNVTGIAGSPVVRLVARELALLLTILLLNLRGLLLISPPRSAG